MEPFFSIRGLDLKRIAGLDRSLKTEAITLEKTSWMGQKKGTLSWMDVDRFRDSPVGHLEPIQGVHLGVSFSHFAFVPDKAPDGFELGPATLNALSDAADAVGRLDGAGRKLPTPSLLVRPTIRREAVSTSALEGTYTTLPEVIQSELFEDEGTHSRDIEEVLAYVRASEEGYRRIQGGKPLSLNLIKDLHGILTKNDPDVPGPEKGEFRVRQNFIGPRDSRVEDSHFVPPPPGGLLRDGLHDWETWIHRQDLPLLLRVAFGHYQFEVLHPFVDGNGRIGRLVTVLMLLEERKLSVPLLSISPYLEARDDEYRQRLRDLSINGEFNSWLLFFLLALKASAEEGLEKSERLLALRDEMVASLRAKRIRGLAIQATEDLIGNPIVTPSAMSERYGVTYQAAAYAIQSMIRVGLLEERTARQRRVYSAPRVFDILR
jgi:Fic family protein